MCAATLALSLAGCSKKSADAGAGAGPCADVAKGVDQMIAKAGGGGGPVSQRSDQLKGILIKHCTEDKWAAEVIDCYANGQSMMDLKTCRGKLPAEQSQRLQGEIMQAMVGGGGGGGGGPAH